MCARPDVAARRMSGEAMEARGLGPTGPDAFDGGPSGARVPTWLDHVAALGWRLLAIGALAAVIALIAIQLATITVSIVIVLVLLATVQPFVGRLRARGWTKGRAAAAGWALAMGAIVVAALVVLAAVVPSAVHTLQTISAGIDALRGHLTDASLSPEASDAIADVGTAVKDWVAGNVSEVVSSVSFLVTVGVLTFFLTFFAMLDADRAGTWILQAASDEQRETLASSGRIAAARVGAFVRGTAAIAAARAVATFAIMWGLGVPDPAPLAAMVFLGTFIPFLGVIATTGAVLAAALGSGGPLAALAALGLIVLTYVAAEVLLRSVARARLGLLDPMAVLVALPIGAAVAGVLGLLLAVPVALAISAITGAVVRALSSNVPQDDGAFVPVWLDRLGQWSWRLLVAILVATAATELVLLVPFIVMPVVLAAVFAATLAPLVRILGRRGLGRTAAALVATGGALVVSVAILALTFASLARQITEIVTTALAGASDLDQALANAVAALRAAMDEAGISLVGSLAGLTRDAAGIVTGVVLSVFLCFFLLRDGAAIWRNISERLAPWRREQADQAASRSVTVLGGYMLGTGAISAFGAITQFAIMFILGLPLALPLAVLSFFGGFIPYIGSFITTGIAFLVTVAVGSPTDILVMLAFTLIFNIVTGNIVAPLVYGKAVNIHPAVVLMAIPAGGAIGGVLGMFLVVPIVGIVATTWRTVLRVFGDPPEETGAGEGDPAPGATPAATDAGGVSAGLVPPPGEAAAGA
jgi:predicted PurR-regulated permease PerM